MSYTMGTKTNQPHQKWTLHRRMNSIWLCCQAMHSLQLLIIWFWTINYRCTIQAKHLWWKHLRRLSLPVSKRRKTCKSESQTKSGTELHKWADDSLQEIARLVHLSRYGDEEEAHECMTYAKGMLNVVGYRPCRIIIDGMSERIESLIFDGERHFPSWGRERHAILKNCKNVSELVLVNADWHFM